jgi:glutamate synthase domain-containing protein 1
MLEEEIPIFDHNPSFKVYEIKIEASPNRLQSMVNQINSMLLDEGKVRGRIFSYGRYVNVFKGVGYPMDVAAQYGLDLHKYEADLWLAHTRQPTNSPGTTPVWSHPFSANDVAVVHNGDISSYGSNVQLLRLAGYLSFVGTDSEVIAFMLDYLLRVKDYSLEQALLVLQNPYEYVVSASSVRDEVKLLMAEARGCQLDGPFTVVAGYCDGKDMYLMALVDRAKFRPIVFGEDDKAYYVASEECQIRSISPTATVWTPEPNGLFVASLNKGILQDGISIHR